MDIVVDFDGTCTTHDFPKVGKDIGAVPVLKKLVEDGHKLILFTMRSDSTKKSDVDNMEKQYLTDAVRWFKQHDIPLYGIQSNPTQKNWTSSPKAYGQLIIDDAALGCPLNMDKKLSDRPFVDWKIVEAMLWNMNILKFVPKVNPADVDMSKVIVTKYNPDTNV